MHVQLKVNCDSLFLTLLLTKVDLVKHAKSNFCSKLSLRVIQSLLTSWSGINVADYESKATNIINCWCNVTHASRRSSYFYLSYSTLLPPSEISYNIVATFGNSSLVDGRQVHPILSLFAYMHEHAIFLQFGSSMICFCSTQAQLALYKSWKEVLDCRKWNCSSVPVITLFVPTSTGMILGLPWLRAMCIAIKLLGPLVIQISQVFQISRSPRCHPGPDIPELLKISLE